MIAREFVNCDAPGGGDVEIHGVRWRSAQAGARAENLLCELRLTSRTGGATLEVAYSVSSRSVADVESRLAERPRQVTGVDVLMLDDLDVGLRSGGVAFREAGAVTFRLYAALRTNVVYVQARLPSAVLSGSDSDDPRKAAVALLTWAASKAPAQR